MAHDHTIINKYSDYIQGVRECRDLPEFQRLIVYAGESDIVMVYASDRFSSRVRHQF